MTKNTNIFLKKHIYLLLSIFIGSFATYCIETNNNFFLAPKSLITENNNHHFKHTYMALLNSKSDLSKAEKDQLSNYISNNDQYGIESLVREFYPTDPNIYKQYTWTSGFSMIIGFDNKTDKIIVIPSSTSSGKDTNIRKPIILDIESLNAQNFITKLIEEKHEEMLLKKYILESGIKTIGGFLFYADTFEKHKILNIYLDLFLKQNPKETLYYIIDNIFEIDNYYAADLINKITATIGTDETFSLVTDILIAQPEANNITNNAYNILIHILPQVSNNTLFKKLNGVKAGEVQILLRKMTEEAPDLFVKTAKYFLVTKEDDTSPFTKNIFEKNMQNVNTKKLQPLLLAIEQDSTDRSLKSLTRVMINNLGLNPYRNLLLIVHDLNLDISLEDSPTQIYNKLINTLHNTQSSIDQIAILELLSSIKADLLPDKIKEDILFFIDKTYNINDTIAAHSVNLIARKKDPISTKILLNILLKEQYTEEIKLAVLNNMQILDANTVFNIGMDILNTKNTYSKIQKTNILQALNGINRLNINSNSWTQIKTFIETNTLSDEEQTLALALIVHINNTDGINYILQNLNNLNIGSEYDLFKLLSFIIQRTNDSDQLIDIAFVSQFNDSTKTEAFNKLETLNLSSLAIQSLFELIQSNNTATTIKRRCRELIQNNLNDHFQITYNSIYKIIHNEETYDDFFTHIEIQMILNNLPAELITEELLALVVFADTNVRIAGENVYEKTKNILEKKYQEQITQTKTATNKEIMKLIETFKEAGDAEIAFNALMELDQVTDNVEDKSYVDVLMKMLDDTSLPMLEDEVTMIGRAIIKAGPKYKKQLAEHIMPILQGLTTTDKTLDTHTSIQKETYHELLKLTGYSHKLLLWNKTLLDWNKFGISSKDIIKGYLHAEDKELFVKEISKVTNIDALHLENVSWKKPSDALINEQFLPAKNIKANQLQKILELLYGYMDTKTDTDITLGEEYEIIGRNNVPLMYYRIFEESNDENEIITPPTNPLYQSLFSRHIPSAKSGVHRTVEQRVNVMDAKLINLFCQLYSLGHIRKNIIIGKELNPKEDDLWSIRYNQHERKGSALDNKSFLLQTTDWKTHTSGSLMWFFMNYADKFPLKWIKLKNLLLEKLENHDVNIYDFNEDSDEKRVSIKKKNEAGNPYFIPKYIYNLTKIPLGENDTAMRVIINDTEITDALSEMIIHTSDSIVKGTYTEKKLFALEALNELYQTVAMGEIPDTFAHYRNATAMNNALEKINEYFRDRKNISTPKMIKETIDKAA